MPTSAANLDHYHHWARRSYLNLFFSGRPVMAMEPMMREQINKLCERQEDAMQTGAVVALDPVISALAADIITILFDNEHLDYFSIPEYNVVGD